MDDVSDTFAPLTDEERAAAGPKAAADDEWTVVTPVPAPAYSLRPFVVWKVEGTWKKPDATWPYRDGEERLLGYACRCDLPPKYDGEKPDKEFSFAAWCRNRKGEWRWKLKHLPAPRPLYNLDKLATRSDASVVICEGEKSADAAARVFPNCVCITSVGGSQVASKADWSPLEGRRVLIWPDADESGAKYAATVAGNLHGQASEILMIDAMALASIGPNGGKREPTKGWDAADARDERQDVDALRRAAHELAKEPLLVATRDDELGKPDEIDLEIVRLAKLRAADYYVVLGTFDVGIFCYGETPAKRRIGKAVGGGDRPP